MRQAKLYRYQLAMDSGIVMREQKLTERIGYVVELIQDYGTNKAIKAYGEIAPLLGFSAETVEQAGEQLLPLVQEWQSCGKWPDFETLYPSVAFGLSMVKLELEGRLPEQGSYHSAPLCSGDPDELMETLDQPDLDTDGSVVLRDKVAKVKVGLYEPIRDGMLTSLLLESLPDLKLRLDANRNWTLTKALKFAQYVAPNLRERIAFIEEPCQTPEESIQFSLETGIALAWDETTQAHKGQSISPSTPFYAPSVKAIVIKPTLIGSVDACIQLIEDAHSRGLQAIISSSLESSLGLTQLARFAAWKTPLSTPGLDTLSMFQQQLNVADSDNGSSKSSLWPNSGLPTTQLTRQTCIWQSK